MNTTSTSLTVSGTKRVKKTTTSKWARLGGSLVEMERSEVIEEWDEPAPVAPPAQGFLPYIQPHITCTSSAIPVPDKDNAYM